MRHIYIVLTQTGTLFSRGIKFFTKEEFNHSSIALDENLNVLYSFGRKVVNNPLIGGFVTERIGQGVFGKFPQTTCAVLKVPVRDAQYEAISKEIKRFVKYIFLFTICFIHIKSRKDKNKASFRNITSNGFYGARRCRDNI
jgi:hypothetical protein